MSEHELREGPQLSRRAVLKAAALGAMATGVSAFLAACGVKTSSPGAAGSTPALALSQAARRAWPRRPPRGSRSRSASSARRPAPAAGFGEPDPYIIGLVQDKLNKGFQAGGKNYAITIVQKDGQSDPAKAAQVANDLITTDKVDLILATSTPENNNPIADAAEAAGVPCIATVEPWEAFCLPAPERPGQTRPLQVHVHLLLRRGGVRQDLRLDVGRHPDQQEGRRHVAERRRRQRHPQRPRA